MYYGMQGYAEDVRAWEAANTARESWVDARNALQAAWDQYEIERQQVASECARLEDAYRIAIANRSRYAQRYAADLLACRQRQEALSALEASITAWKRQHGIVGSFSSPPCATAAQKAIWRNTCEAATQIKGLGADDYRDVSRDDYFRTSVIGPRYAGSSVYCALKDLPTCPTLLNCDGLTPPGAIPKPACNYPQAPRSMTTIGPMPPDPGARPSSPELTPTTVTLPPDVESPPEEEEEEDTSASSFALYGILAVLVMGGGYALYRTLKK
jgi:hypothetical protein